MSERSWTLTLGPEHPAGHGPIAFQLQVDGVGSDEVVTWAEPLIHPLHRGAEKLFESRDYRQILMLADRHDWHSSFGSELGLALTVEASLGMSVPERATWIRTLVAELARAIHHLRWLGETAWEIDGAADPEVAQLRECSRDARERLTELLEQLSGGRMHPMLIQVGGLREDTPEGWTDSVRTAASATASVTSELAQWASSCTALDDVAPLSASDALTFGVSGPVGRASGLALDLRFDDPYCAYPDLIEAGVLTRVGTATGDAQARLEVLAKQLQISLSCVGKCADRLDLIGPSDVDVILPRTLRVPEGEYYGWAENATGINGWYLISRGGIEPYRLHLRTASFANAQALSAILPGTPVAKLPTALMSFLLVAGDLAK